MNKKRIAKLLLTMFFMVAFVEVIAEFNQDKILVWYTKPLLMPLLITYYLKRSKKINPFYVAALLFTWIANIFFIESAYKFIIFGSIFYLLYRLVIIYIVLKQVKMPSFFPLLIGMLPFIFVYFSASVLTYDRLGSNLYIFLTQGVFTIILGGLSLGNYILASNRTNMLLFVSTMLSAITQFLFVLKFFSDEDNLLHAFAMTLFISGQFLLTKYMFLNEKYKQRYEIIKDFKNVNT